MKLERTTTVFRTRPGGMMPLRLFRIEHWSTLGPPLAASYGSEAHYPPSGAETAEKAVERLIAELAEMARSPIQYALDHGPVRPDRFSTPRAIPDSEFLDPYAPADLSDFQMGEMAGFAAYEIAEPDESDFAPWFCSGGGPNVPPLSRGPDGNYEHPTYIVAKEGESCRACGQTERAHLLTLANPYSETCPVCDAQPLSCCWAPTGGVTDVHIERLRRAGHLAQEKAMTDADKKVRSKELADDVLAMAFQMGVKLEAWQERFIRDVYTGASTEPVVYGPGLSRTAYRAQALDALRIAEQLMRLDDAAQIPHAQTEHDAPHPRDPKSATRTHHSVPASTPPRNSADFSAERFPNAEAHRRRMAGATGDTDHAQELSEEPERFRAVTVKVPELPVYTSPWPGVSGRSTEHEVAVRGCANRVRVLTCKGQDALVSWRDGKHMPVEAAERMLLELAQAIDIARDHEDPWVCELCGQRLGGPAALCNSHVGPGDGEEAQGEAIRLSESDFEAVTLP